MHALYSDLNLYGKSQSRFEKKHFAVLLHDERAVLETVIEEDRLYVADRGYQKFALTK